MKTIYYIATTPDSITLLQGEIQTVDGYGYTTLKNVKHIVSTLNPPGKWATFDQFPASSTPTFDTLEKAYIAYLNLLADHREELQRKLHDLTMLSIKIYKRI